MLEAGWVMETKELYREILNEHNINPLHKTQMENPTITLNGVNPSCGDNITLNMKIEGDIITDASFTGNGCAISQASCDMMIDLVIGKKASDAIKDAETFMNMIQGKATDNEIESLEDAAVLKDIARMPARVKCAELGWRTLKEMILSRKPTQNITNAHC